MAHAFCYRSGEIGIDLTIPNGALPLMSGNRSLIEHRISARARHGYDGKTLLVPGIPEAQSEDEAEEAYLRFKEWINRAPEADPCLP